jgi:hypothetical protein
LGNLVHFARGQKHRLYLVMRTLRDQLEAVATAASTLRGDDRPHIIRGLAVHRVLSDQAKRLPELKHAPPVDSKMGHCAVAIGVAASVLIVFASLLIDEKEASLQSLAETQALERKLRIGVVNAHYALLHWRASGFHTPFEEECRRVEIRTLERALAGVDRAQARAAALRLHPIASYKLQLVGFRRAAWPTGCVVDAASQASLLARIATGELVDASRAAEMHASEPGVIPLSALPASLWSSARKQDDASSEGDSGHTASVSTFSFASSASVASGSSDGDLVGGLQRLGGSRLFGDVVSIE